VRVCIDRVAAVWFVQEAKASDPIYAESRYVIVPANTPPAPELSSDRIVPPIAAAMAFRSGRHDRTQLCLEALAKFLCPGDSVLDVGCGSGLLALAC
jgi:ribosomal protein L11 methyltransferase